MHLAKGIYLKKKKIRVMAKKGEFPNPTLRVRVVRLYQNNLVKRPKRSYLVENIDIEVSKVQ